MKRLLVAVVLMLGALPTATPLVAAQDAESPAAVFFEDGVDDIASRAGAAYWKASESARKAGLHAFAFEAAQVTIAFDPDHKRARKHLGFVKKRGEWELDADEARKVPRENEHPKRMSDDAFAERQRKWRDEDLAAAGELVAARYADLGDRCEKNDYDVEARRAREEALRLDPDCAKARAALGFQKVGESWLTAAQKAAREAASAPERFTEDSHLDEVLGVTLMKVRSANVRAESVFGSEQTMALVAALETTYTYYLTDIGRDPNERALGKPVRVALLADEHQWGMWLKDQVPRRAEVYRPLFFYRHSGALLLAVRENQENAAGTTGLMEDNAVHAFTHILNDVVWKLFSHPWLDEGLAYYYTLKVRGTTESWCVQSDDSRYGGEAGADTDEKVTEAVWRHRVKELVRNGNDMDLRMLSARTLNELKLSETMKAWSVATWLMDDDRDGALRLFERIGKSPTGAEALEAHFGRPVEETDAAWRAWVLRTH